MNLVKVVRRQFSADKRRYTTTDYDLDLVCNLIDAMNSGIAVDDHRGLLIQILTRF